MGWMIFVSIVLIVGSYLIGYQMGYSKALGSGRVVIEKLK
jgi:hypothetical protein